MYALFQKMLNISRHSIPLKNLIYKEKCESNKRERSAIT